MNKKRYLITSALPYANGPLHIGHLAGAYLPADVYVRYLRLMGKDVVFVCGSDEHGAAITVKARKEGVSPREIVDKYHVMLRDTLKGIGIDFDIYHRTSEPLHHETAQGFFRKLLENGEFIEETTEQFYDPEAEQFLADRYIAGTCPNCGNPDAYGDQCEKCGSTLSPNELIDPRSTLSGAKPVKKPTAHWFLKLDQHEAWLREWINTGMLDGEKHHDPKAWKNHVLGQCNSWLDQGLNPRAMTRDLEWGVDVPQDIPGSKGKKLYVWLDAPIGYISATRQWAKDHNKDWELYWKDKDTALIHFIGKDNIVFHCLTFPTILKAYGDFVLPVNVPANQFVNLEGRKLSTSKNWAVWVHEYLEDFHGMEDVLRYAMIKNMPEQKDSEFTWKGFQDYNNTELVNNLANFVNRVMVLTHKYFEGTVPDISSVNSFKSGWSDAETTMEEELRLLATKVEAIGKEIERFNLREALRLFMEVSSAGNVLLQANEPWKQFKQNPDAVRVVLNMGLQYVAVLSEIVQPFMPFTAERMRYMLNLLGLSSGGDLKAMLNTLAEGKPLVPAGHPINEAEHLFTRISDDAIQAQVDKLYQMAQAAEGGQKEEVDYPPMGETIDFDDFMKMDIRTGTILEAEKMPKSKKLLKLKVDMGFEQRTILSGIALHYNPEEVVGKEVIVLANLAPRKMMGIESEGMILMASDAEGKLSFVQPEAGWPSGFKVS